MWSGQRGVVKEEIRENRKRFVTRNVFAFNTPAFAITMHCLYSRASKLLPSATITIAGLASRAGGFGEHSNGR